MNNSLTMNRPSHQSGMSLIEILVAIVILSVGLLGLVALQAKALRNNQSSFERTSAVVLTYSIADRMRANPTQFTAGNYAIAVGAAPATTGLANADLTAWRNDITAALGSGASGSVSCASNICTISIQWDDTRGITAFTGLSISTLVRI
jgi:type IV pilus assembly protein PilV